MPKQEPKLQEPKLYEIDEEIFAEGIWNGRGFSVEDLEKIASSFNALSEEHQVPLKMGHNEEQPMTDGQPALGWVEKLWVEGKKLMGKFIDVPEIVYEAMQQKKYRNKSIELDFDVSYKGTKYEYVLSGVALLGADIPAVNTLNDLSYYLASRRASYAAAKSMNFTTPNNYEDKTVDELQTLKAKIDTLEQSVGILKGENKTLKDENAVFSRQVEDFEAKDKERDKAEAKAAFDRNVKAFKSDVEKLVEEKKITPATRDKLVADLDDDVALVKAKYTVEVIADNGKLDINDTGEGFSDNKQEDGMAPDEILVFRIDALQSENPKLSFTDAKQKVFEKDKDLARAYINMT